VPRHLSKSPLYLLCRAADLILSLQLLLQVIFGEGGLPDSPVARQLLEWTAELEKVIPPKKAALLGRSGLAEVLRGSVSFCESAQDGEMPSFPIGLPAAALYRLLFVFLTRG